MAKNICPYCSHVTLSLGSEFQVKCFQCEKIFEVLNREHEPVDISISEGEEE